MEVYLCFIGIRCHNLQPRRLVTSNGYESFPIDYFLVLLFDPEDGSHTLIRNTGELLMNTMPSHPRR
jgi:hypothetical protein